VSVREETGGDRAASNAVADTTAIRALLADAAPTEPAVARVRSAPAPTPARADRRRVAAARRALRSYAPYAPTGPSRTGDPRT
jgi:hypothetical protein